MQTFIHISDLHFPTALPLFSLRNKMIAGYINFYIRRRHKHPEEIREALLRFISKTEYDGLFITGDLTNVSGEKEFERARELLEPVLDERTFVIPGNHDRYTKQSIEPVRLFEKYFSRYTGISFAENEKLFLRYKTFRDLYVIGWDSNEPRSLTEACGEIHDEVIDTTFIFLRKKGIQSYLLLCHHPLWNPSYRPEPENHSLKDKKGRLEKLKTFPPLVYLHGHHHTNYTKKSTDELPFTIINSASSTRVSDSHHDCGFHLVRVEQDKVDVERFVYNFETRDFKKGELLSF
ncbi:MAG: metallophosphoesterase [Leptospiraceae bacterium]|nr:metallophosphoesterase [Leptospiraceae bacterium]MCP5499102.1 metallophosphoesterase [Leptospiraceae bacterium]